jgi:hypothetical protein
LRRLTGSPTAANSDAVCGKNRTTSLRAPTSATLNANSTRISAVQRDERRACLRRACKRLRRAAKFSISSASASSAEFADGSIDGTTDGASMTVAGVSAAAGCSRVTEESPASSPAGTNLDTARIDGMIRAEHADESPFGTSLGIHGGQFGLRFCTIREPDAFAPHATDGAPRRAQRGWVESIGC